MPTPEQAIDIGERLGLSRDEAEDVGFEIVGSGGLLAQIHSEVGTKVPTDAFRAFLGSTTFRGWKMEQKQFAQTLLEQALQERGGVPDIQEIMDAYRALERGGPVPPTPPTTVGTKRLTPGAQPAGAGGPPQPQRPGGGGGNQRGGGGRDGGGGREAQSEREKTRNTRVYCAGILERAYGRTIRLAPDGSPTYGFVGSETTLKQEARDHLRGELPIDQYPNITDAKLDEYINTWLSGKIADLRGQRDKGQKGEKEAKKAEAEKQRQKRDNPDAYALEFLNGHSSRIEYNEKTGKAGPLNNRTADALKQELVEKLRLEFPLPEFTSITDTKLRDYADTWYDQTVAEKEIQVAVRKIPKKSEERIAERIKAVKDKLRLIGYSTDLIDAATVEKDFGKESKEKALHKIVQKLLSQEAKDERLAKADLFATVGTKYGLSETQCNNIYDALKLELIASAQAQEKIKGKFWRIFRPHTRQGKITKAAAFAGVGVASAVGFGWLGLVATGGLRAIDRLVTRAVDKKLLDQYRTSKLQPGDDNNRFRVNMQNRLAGLIVETKRRGLEAAPSLAKEAARKTAEAQTIQNDANIKVSEATQAREIAEQAKNALPAAKDAEKTARAALTAAQKTEDAAVQEAREKQLIGDAATEQALRTMGTATALARTAFDRARKKLISIEAEAKKFNAKSEAEQNAKDTLEQVTENFNTAKKIWEKLDTEAQRSNDFTTAKTPSKHYFDRIFDYLLAENTKQLDERLRMAVSELQGVAEHLAVYYAMDDEADRVEREAEEKRKFLTLPEQIPFSEKLNALFSKRLTALIGKIPPEKPRDFALAGAGATALGLTIIKGIRYTSPLASRLAGAYEGLKLGEAVHETGARLSASERIEKEIAEAKKSRENAEREIKKPEDTEARMSALDELEKQLSQLSLRLEQFPHETKAGAKFLEWKEKVRELTLTLVIGRFEKREADTAEASHNAITKRLEKLKKPRTEAVTARNKTFSEKTWREKGAALLPTAETAKRMAKQLTGAAAGLALAEAGIRLADLK